MDAAAVPIIISLGALVVAGYVGLRQLGLQQRVTKIEEARREEEVTSRLEAEVTARFEFFISNAGTQAYRFVLWNQGPARAEEVDFEILTPVKGVAPFVRMEGHHLPVSLDRDQFYRMMCTVPGGYPALEGQDGATRQDPDTHGD